MEKAVLGAYNHAHSWIGSGRVASYIPQLKAANIHHLGVAITDMQGNLYSAGDSRVPFTMQSISKLIILAAALQDVGFERVFSCVGMEPTGDAFNSIVRLEAAMDKPMNPMINAGAISVVTCIEGATAELRFEKILNLARLLLNSPSLTYDENVYLSESKTGDKNRALAYMMKSNGVIGGDVGEHLEVYFKACSLLVTCEELSYFAAVLANNGVAPKTGVQILPPFGVKVIRSLMTTCGLYDASGEYALRVGIPSKSGVGGGIIGAVPNKMGIAVFSPGLDQKGNSFCGIKAMEYLSQVLDLSIF
ncbi:MAG: glutaminase A [Oscillospiraceae bacterium]